MKKIIFGLGLLLAGVLTSQAQTLDGIIVEKYHVADAADHTADPSLPIGAVTYRIYVDMPNYVTVDANTIRLSSVFGNDPSGDGSVTQPILFGTTTTFFNTGSASTGNAINAAATGSALYDSWMSLGAADASNVGVLLTDNAAGKVAGSPSAFSNTAEYTFASLFTAPGNIVSSIYDAAGVVGPTTANRVLIAQLTTDGQFTYRFNVNLKDGLGNSKNFVSINDQAGEVLVNALHGTITPKVAPTVTFTVPAVASTTIQTGASVTLSATANANDTYTIGDVIDSVAFFAGATKIGNGTLAAGVYSLSYTPTGGALVNASYSITAVAYDHEGGSATSAAKTIIVTNDAPVVSITAPAAGAVSTGSINITSSPTDNGSVASVEYFVGGVSIGTATTPYTLAHNFNTAGTFVITSQATDEEGKKSALSAGVSIIVSNPAPVVTITAPVNGATTSVGSVVAITGTATDDGTVSTIEIRVNGTLVNTPASSPFSYNYTIASSGSQVIQVRAIDEEGAVTSTSVSVIVPSAISYAILRDSMSCYQGTKFNLPVYRTNSISNVYGFDIELTYEKDQVAPTGFVSINDDMINHLYAGYSVDVKEGLGKMIISVYLNGLGGIDLFDVAAGDTAQVVSVEFERLPAFALNDSVLFSANVVESFDTYTVLNQVQPGYFTVKGTDHVNGTLEYWSDNEAIGYNGTNLITEITPSLSATAFTPDANGEFTYNFANGDSITVARDIADDTDVMPIVNGFDALLTAFVVVEDPRFTPNIYQIIAMDVNMDGVISSGDVSQINQRTTALRQEFVQVGAAGKDWAFIDESDVISNPNFKISTTYPLSDGVGYSKNMIPSVGDYISLNEGECASPEKTIKGIMIGDANGSYKNLSASYAQHNLLKSESISENVVENGTVTLDLGKAIETETTIDVPVIISSDFAIQTLDFALLFNQDNLKYVGIVNDNSDLKTMAYFNEADQTLRFTSYSFNELSQDGATIYIRFEKQNEVAIADITAPQAYLNGEPVQSQVVKTDKIIAGPALVANIYPSPVTDKLNIVVSENSDIVILNVLSQEVLDYGKAAANFVNTIDVSQLPKGTYFVSITGETSQLIKVIVKE
jgi:hypothetical protein